MTLSIAAHAHDLFGLGTPALATVRSCLQELSRFTLRPLKDALERSRMVYKIVPRVHSFLLAARSGPMLVVFGDISAHFGKGKSSCSQGLWLATLAGSLDILGIV